MAVVLITGANRGIGLALVKAYAGRRDKVFAAIRATSDRFELDQLVKESPKWIEVIEMDVSDAAEIGRARRRLEAEPIDVLINNAGIGGPERQTATDMDFDGLIETLNVNTIAPLRVATAFLPNVKAAKGKIITLSSQMGQVQSASTDSLAYRVRHVIGSDQHTHCLASIFLTYVCYALNVLCVMCQSLLHVVKDR